MSPKEARIRRRQRKEAEEARLKLEREKRKQERERKKQEREAEKARLRKEREEARAQRLKEKEEAKAQRLKAKAGRTNAESGEEKVKLSKAPRDAEEYGEEAVEDLKLSHAPLRYSELGEEAKGFVRSLLTEGEHSKKDVNIWAKMFGTIFHYARQVPSLERMFDAASNLAENKNKLLNRLFNGETGAMAYRNGTAKGLF